ncbi:type I-B CRISPR-associated protein Cas5b [Thermodesulfovibrio sp. 1176]|uniref:type I-B CRISPR-associated protein Cas5b n=1 Tax=Thermodesulfovibrio sp. 1176 TaxID=3043424 RepID=UPI002482F1D4|nr:type I-B CRISPR-associated protein Cas5b [Thermodesulfovibrio sp. 1176]MDI1471660.1 type I-B CRISPR-associated protein Cas5b [Thermodesulfovibrio sp. 1176]
MQHTKQVLKIKIHQPSAHYRIPFSYQRRFTYPIPPYSTIKGLICNLMGIRDEGDERLTKIKGLSLAIYGRYESLIKEYIWFRNLSKNSHVDKFHSVTNRTIDNIPQHPGGQMPVTVDVLQDVNLIIYIYHPEENFLKSIKKAFEDPSERLSPIHLGRSEDWLVFQEIKSVELIQKSAMSIKYFAWIPAKEYVDKNFIDGDYDNFFDGLNGNIFRLPTFYKITDTNQRVFEEYVTVKLYEGESFKKMKFYVDSNENIPVIFTILRGNKDARNSG